VAFVEHVDQKEREEHVDHVEIKVHKGTRDQRVIRDLKEHQDCVDQGVRRDLLDVLEHVESRDTRENVDLEDSAGKLENLHTVQSSSGLTEDTSGQLILATSL